jgi:hypothetical protein
VGKAVRESMRRQVAVWTRGWWRRAAGYGNVAVGGAAVVGAASLCARGARGEVRNGGAA